MDSGHITQLVKDELGPNGRAIYHQDLTVPQPRDVGRPPHLRIDSLSAGAFIFVDSGVTGSQPTHSYQTDGLLLSVLRPKGATVNLGEWAAAKTQGLALMGVTLPVPATAAPGKRGSTVFLLDFQMWA